MIPGNLMSPGPKNDEHLVPFHPWPRLYFSDLDQILLEFLQDARAKFSVRHLTAAKPDCGLHLVATFQPLLRVLHAIVVIVIVRARSKLYFLDGDRYLLLFRLVRFLLGFVLKLSEVNDAANWRIGGGSNFHEIQTFFPRGADGVANIHHAKLLAFVADDTYLGNTNSFVNAGDGLAPVIRTLAATAKACSYTSPPKVRSFELRVSVSILF